MEWTYDNAGRLISAADPDSAYSYSYDLAGNMLSVDNAGTPNVPNVVFNFAYDYAGNRTSLTDSLGGAIEYSYADHRLASMTRFVSANEVGTVDLAYDTVGRLTTVTRTSYALSTDPQIVTAYAYDNGDRLTSIIHSSVVAGEEPTMLSQFSYAFDSANQITSYTGPEGTLNYSYDNTGQLTGVSGARSESYSFDLNGNRTMTAYTTGADNRLTSDGTYNYTYDNDGNTLMKTRISDGQVTTNMWDYRNRLTNIVVTDADGNVLKEARYTYDVNDRRIGVWEHVTDQTATQRWTVYDGVNPFADFDASGSLITQYLYGPAADQLFARVSATANLDWYLTDNLGSVRQIVRSDGTVLDNIAFDSFGQILSESAPPSGDRFRFTGRDWDVLFGQYFYRARYYSPEVGRFASEDPTSFTAGDTDFYRYVANNPTNYIDPTGLDQLKPRLGDPGPDGGIIIGEPGACRYLPVLRSSQTELANGTSKQYAGNDVFPFRSFLLFQIGNQLLTS